MASHTRRLPRKYRYRGRGDIPKPILVIAAAVVVMGAAGAHQAGHHAAAGGVREAAAGIARGPAPGGGTLSCSGLEALWESAGGSPRAAFLAAEIAMAESSGRQYASLFNTNGTTDRGYWQINSIHGSLSTFGAHANARAAVLISSDGADWTPWTTYQTGAYAGKC
jgi:lysozyme-like protein